MTDTTHTLDDVQRSLSRGQRNLGAFVYWNNLTDVRIDRSMFRQGFRMCGLGKAVAKDPKPEASLNQAAMIANRRQGKDAPASVELKHKGDEAVYCVLMRRDVADRRRYLEEATIAVERGGPTEPTPTIAIDASSPPDDARDSIIAAVIENYTELRGYAHTQEMSETLMRAMGVVNAISLRTGVYFVQYDKVPTVRLLKAFLETNTCATMSVWEIRDTDDNTTEAKKNAREAFTDRINELIAEVKDFTSRNPNPDDVQTKSINARVKQFKDLDGRVGLWADILGDYQAELRATIADAKQKLLGAYLGESDDDSNDVVDAVNEAA